jgi:serine/threonine protein kinase
MTLMKQELHICEQLEHPHIVRVLDLIEDHMNIYIVMEYINGGHMLDLLVRTHQDPKYKLSEQEIGAMIH